MMMIKQVKWSMRQLLAMECFRFFSLRCWLRHFPPAWETRIIRGCFHCWLMGFYPCAKAVHVWALELQVSRCAPSSDGIEPCSFLPECEVLNICPGWFSPHITRFLLGGLWVLEGCGGLCIAKLAWCCFWSGE